MTVKKYFSIREIAERFSLSPQTVLRQIHAGKLEAMKFGKSYRVPVKAIEDLEANLNHA